LQKTKFLTILVTYVPCGPRNQIFLKQIIRKQNAALYRILVIQCYTNNENGRPCIL